MGRTLVSDLCWNYLLVDYLCTRKALRIIPNARSQEIGDVRITHYDNVEVIEEIGLDTIADYDLIIQGVSVPDDHPYVRRLSDRVEELYREFNGRLLSRPLPQVVVFPTGKRGGALDPALFKGERPRFLQLLSQVGLRPEGRREFEVILIRTLKDCVANALGLPFPRGIEVLDNWLSQFEPDDQPLALRMLRSFRYYPAETQRKLLDLYLNTIDKQDGDVKAKRCLTYLGRPNKSGPAVLTLAAKTTWASQLAAEKRLTVKTYDDLLVHLAAETKQLTGGKSLDIYFVDDVIGSGGQLISYLEKFLNDHLSSGHRRMILESILEGGRLRLHVVFVIGISSGGFEKLFVKGLDPVQISSSKFLGTRSRVGDLRVNVRVRNGPKGLREVNVKVHVIDYTPSIFELFEKNELPRAKFESLLKSYFGITKPRAREHWLQFEPFGWKGGGALVSTHLNCPGNTLPIIWAEGGVGKEWKPLFARYFNPWDDGGKTLKAVTDSLGFEAEKVTKPTREKVAYVLHALTGKSAAEIARIVKLNEEQVRSTIQRVEDGLFNDEKYRDELASLFRQVS